MQEAVRAQQEESGRVLKGVTPEGPNHRNILQKLMGGACVLCAVALVRVALVYYDKGVGMWGKGVGSGA